jgi:hypothetical protein
MATGQNLLDMMELANQELQLQPTEVDVARGLTALNVAQDFFENLMASRKIKAGTTNPTTEISATANVETTAFPTGFIRIDRIWRLDGTGGNPVAELENLKRTGGHRMRSQIPWIFQSSTGSGTPAAYWTQGYAIYWSPKPSATTYYRVYGQSRAADITAVGAFTYDEGVMFPLASFAARIMATGVADSSTDLSALSTEFFEKVLDTLERFNRDGGQDLTYTRVHTE